MRLFVVTSVYQFLNALTVQMNHPDEPSDILCAMHLLNDTFDLEKLREEGIFQNVYVWTGDICRFRMVSRSKKELLVNSAKKVLLACRRKKLQKQIPKPEKHYDEICLAYPDYPSRLAFETLRDEDTHCSLLEDGTFTYEIFSQKQSKLKSYAFRMLVGADVMELTDRIYVYRPEMLRLADKKAEVVTISSELKKIGPIIKRIYKQELPDEALIDRTAIIFDQNLDNPIVSSLRAKTADLCADILGRDQVVVKLHPHALSSPYSDQVDICRAKCPFEILMSTMDIQNKVLLSLFSTACMNPKMMLDAEPIVIFTGKLSDAQGVTLLNPELLTLIERFRDSYRDPRRVYIPETMEELESILKDLKIKFDNQASQTE